MCMFQEVHPSGCSRNPCPAVVLYIAKLTFSLPEQALLLAIGSSVLRCYASHSSSSSPRCCQAWTISSKKYCIQSNHAKVWAIGDGAHNVPPRAVKCSKVCERKRLAVFHCIGGAVNKDGAR